MIAVVKEYNNYVKRIPSLIESTHYKAEYFINLLGLKTATYYRKLRENAFTSEEIEKITTALYPKEAYLEELKAELNLAEEDIKNGRVVAHADVLKKLKEKYE